MKLSVGIISWNYQLELLVGIIRWSYQVELQHYEFHLQPHGPSAPVTARRLERGSY